MSKSRIDGELNPVEQRFEFVLACRCIEERNRNLVAKRLGRVEKGSGRANHDIGYLWSQPVSCGSPFLNAAENDAKREEGGRGD